MKKMILFISLMPMCSVIYAREYKDNPDRFPSIGLNLTGISQSGTSNTYSNGGTYTQDAEIDQNSIVVDGRFPVSNNLTLNFGVGAISGKAEAKETVILNGGKDDLSGAIVNVGVRWYIH